MKPAILLLLSSCIYGLAGVSLTGISAQPSEACRYPFIIPMPPLDSPLFPFSYEDAWRGVGEFSCGAPIGPPDGNNLDSQVRSIAGIVANHTAAVLSTCRAFGRAEDRSDAQLLAVRRAAELANVTAFVLSTVPECQGCKASNDIAQLYRELLVEAVTGSWTEIYVFSDNGVNTDDLSDLTSIGVVDTISGALPQIAATVRNLSCIGVDTTLSIEGFLNRCNISNQDVSIDAMATTGAELISFLCSNSSSSTMLEFPARVVARVVAENVAEAVVQADLACKGSDPDSLNPMPCELLEADVTAVVIRQTDAFFIGAAELDICGCGIAEDFEEGLFDAIAAEWVSAAKNAYAETCIAAGNGDLSPGDVSDAIEPRMLEATAEVIALLEVICGGVGPGL